MSPGSSTESYPAFAHIELRENPGKNLNQVTCPDRDSIPGHLVSRPNALTITPQLEEIARNYTTKKGLLGSNIERPLELRDWPYPADFPAVQDTKPNEDYAYEIYTDGSKSSEGVDSGVAVFFGGDLVQQSKFRLHGECSNNQAEQFAILKALHIVNDLQLQHNTPKTASLYTDSKITLDSLQNSRNHNSLIEEIRKELTSLRGTGWIITFSWVKAHIGIFGNELADRLAKKATREDTLHYSKIPMSGVTKTLGEESLANWENQWQLAKNGAETRRYFPQVSQRLALHIPVSAGLTTMLTGHGRINAYYHRFRIIQDPTCSCNNGEETVEHILLECTKYNKPRNKLKMIINFKGGRWPPNKTDLMEKYLKEYCKFIGEVDLESRRNV
ncbi:hypothetical protein ANN_19422 [Periplaneta americana]|uniref:ribonuclease H n=1 Tax=Periplaneta americana TaxID=6978 RepID=A0ABQ8SAB7_PERAM|nr:hypothetical protein ANN_19422 [Periplaneta americana]